MPGCVQPARKTVADRQQEHYRNQHFNGHKHPVPTMENQPRPGADVNCLGRLAVVAGASRLCPRPRLDLPPTPHEYEPMEPPSKKLLLQLFGFQPVEIPGHRRLTANV